MTTEGCRQYSTNFNSGLDLQKISDRCKLTYMLSSAVYTLASSKKLDARIVRSRARLEAALLALLAEKPLRDINIAELTKAAGMSRQTFYLHYDNIEEVLIRKFERSLAGFRAEMAAALARDTIDIPAISARLFAYWRANREAFDAIRTAGLEREFLARIRDYVSGVTAELRRIQDAPAADVDIERYIDDFVSGGLFVMLTRWLDEGCPQSPKEMGKLLDQLTKNFRTVNTQINR